MRPHARLRLAVAVSVVALVATSGLVIGISAAGLGARPAIAAAAAVPDSTDPDTAEAYRALAIQVSRNNAMLAQLTTQLDATNVRLVEIAAAIEATGAAAIAGMTAAGTTAAVPMVRPRSSWRN